MPKEPPELKPYLDADGDVRPPETFDNDLPFRPETVDTSPGSLYDHITQRIKQIRGEH